MADAAMMTTRVRESHGLAIITGGMIAGAADIAYALIFSAMDGIPPTVVLQSVAAGLHGRAAYAGGAGMAALGLALHFLMATIIAATFVVTRSRWTSLAQQPALLIGPLYGVAVYFVMNRVVVPLSNFPMPEGGMKVGFLSLAVHMFLVGLPIAWAAQLFGRWSPSRSS